MFRASDWSTKFFEMQVKFLAERNLRIWSTKCEKQFVLKTVYDYLNTTFLVLRALQTDDLNYINSIVHACLTSCNFDNIMHAINETLISIIMFWHKSKVFVEINGPLSSMNFYNEISFFLSSNTNTIQCNK